MIRFDDRWVGPIQSGQKTTTIRIKERPPAYEGELRVFVIDHPNWAEKGGRRFAFAKIIKVRNEEIKYASMEKEGFAHEEDAVRYLSEKYTNRGVIHRDTKVWVIEFELMKDEPE